MTPFLIYMALLLGVFVGILVASAIWIGTVEGYRKDCENHEFAAMKLARENARLRNQLSEFILTTQEQDFVL